MVVHAPKKSSQNHRLTTPSIFPLKLSEMTERDLTALFHFSSKDLCSIYFMITRTQSLVVRPETSRCQATTFAKVNKIQQPVVRTIDCKITIEWLVGFGPDLDTWDSRPQKTRIASWGVPISQERKCLECSTCIAAHTEGPAWFVMCQESAFWISPCDRAYLKSALVSF